MIEFLKLQQQNNINTTEAIKHKQQKHNQHNINDTTLSKPLKKHNRSNTMNKAEQSNRDIKTTQTFENEFFAFLNYFDRRRWTVELGLEHRLKYIYWNLDRIAQPTSFSG